MDRFSKFHPFISFSFFISVITVTIFFTDSFLTVTSFFSAFLYYTKLKRLKAVKTFIKFIVPIVFFAAFFNMLFVRYGEMVLFSVKGLNFTVEGLTAGLFTGLMIGAVMMWFFCYNEIITSEKFMALFGGIAPNLTLLISMILRFIPLMIRTEEEIKDANKGMGTEIKGLKNALHRFSALLSICLEKSIETADSMKARGFGKKKRSFYSSFDIRFSDGAAAVFIISAAVLVFSVSLKSYPMIIINPGIKILHPQYLPLSVFTVLSVFPLLADVTEDIKWLLLKSKI